mmetsp:Transcript_8363/g.30856  ORF Transcript_8363/g.30856 Transcript_8363/m.30856 type:complete len:105 (+) Transcript_8363:1808-2122(+)
MDLFCSQYTGSSLPSAYCLHPSPRTRLTVPSALLWRRHRRARHVVPEALCRLASSLRDLDAALHQTRSFAPVGLLQVVVIAGALYIWGDGDRYGLVARELVLSR